VVLWSHLINTADTQTCHEFLATCRRHVRSDGVVLLWRHEPGWIRNVEAFRRHDGDGLVSELHSVVHDGDRLLATVAWEFDGERYEQPFEAVEVDDATLEQLAAAHGFKVAGVFDPDGMLVRLEVVVR
jgi:hypothetical protein